MAYIPENWTNKNQRAALAVEHTKVVTEKYREEIAASIENTVLYEKSEPCEMRKEYKTRICIIDALQGARPVYSRRLRRG